MAKVLRMSFQNAGGRAISVNLREPVDPLNPVLVGTCMDKVVVGNIFNTSGGDIVSKLKAETIETSVETVVDYT